MHHVPYDPHSETQEKSRGAIWLLAAAGLAIAWAGAVCYGAYLQAGLALIHQPIAALANLAALALCPAVAMMFAGLAAREAVRAGAKSERLANLASALIDPSHRTLDAGERARTLRADIAALDHVVATANQRLDLYAAGLRRDGVVLARALKSDVESLRALRGELNTEAQALAGAFAANTQALRTATAELKTQASEANHAVAAQVESFGAAFAHIGARSAEFAAAARTTETTAADFDAAVAKALDALAHATSLNDSARKATEESALVAHETARAVRDATARAVAEAREASRMIRAEARGVPAAANDAVISGRHVAENIKPPRRTVIPFFKPKAPRPEKAPAPVPAPANDYSATLADIVRLAGVEASFALSPADLAHIAYAGRNGVDARRNAVRTVAREDLRRLSSTFRASSDARRAAEILRKRPALGDGYDSDTQRDLMSAYLLVDAALG
ncbi:MAG TPA: hypothetical protein VG735_13045 [Caulobacterales bacterium]|nr:hypothetical protein [Caulobacterales bacterium]